MRLYSSVKTLVKMQEVDLLLSAISGAFSRLNLLFLACRLYASYVNLLSQELNWFAFKGIFNSFA
jgi:hypothetical protein